MGWYFILWLLFSAAGCAISERVRLGCLSRRMNDRSVASGTITRLKNGARQPR